MPGRFLARSPAGVLEQRDEEASVLPEPVPVVTSVGSGRASFEAEPHPGLGLMLVRTKASGRPVQMRAPRVVRRAERSAEPHVGTTEDAVVRISDEALELGAHVVVRQSERRAQETRQRSS